ncbi:MAG: hypothetical protein Q8J76_00435, partial [Desulfobulbaceae bacterium]|nr:hypothetical protein [Desulfobulbaceae bacterium]
MGQNGDMGVMRGGSLADNSLDRVRAIFEPGSVAVVGASQRKGSVGLAVFRNLLEGGFSGVIYPVN